MRIIDLLDMLKKDVQDYRLQANESINRNAHMNEVEGTSELWQHNIDALLVDFLNFVAKQRGVDYGLRTEHLVEKTTQSQVVVAIGHSDNRWEEVDFLTDLTYEQCLDQSLLMAEVEAVLDPGDDVSFVVMTNYGDKHDDQDK